MSIKKMYQPIIMVAAWAMLLQCNQPDKTNTKKKNNTTLSTMKVTKLVYGTTKKGEQVHSFTLVNKHNTEVKIIEFGAIVASIKTDDNKGKTDDIVLGYDTVEEWENDPYYFGATIGRVANRTSNASFTLENKTYNLAANTLPDFGNNHLHGGKNPFSKVVWKGTEYNNAEEVGVVLTYLSTDGEEGYPGNLTCEVTYSLNNQGELKITYKATTDKTTLVNLTHHSYFNLNGAGNKNIFEHLVQINADNYTPADSDLIPTGEVATVQGLPIDFTSPTQIGDRIMQMKQDKFTGYDLNYVLNNNTKQNLTYAGKAISLKTGRVLEVFTTQPCMHFYTSNFLSGKTGKNGAAYAQYGAFCFEPQGYPDAANKPQFTSIELAPGNEYNQTIIYKFSTQK